MTHYRVMKRIATRALIELTPETGRRNQNRVHLADAKYPIIGDHKYGARTNPARRLGLHASSLQFKHPLSGELLRFESPLPQDLCGRCAREASGVLLSCPTTPTITPFVGAGGAAGCLIRHPGGRVM